ncbi:MAG: PAS domain-containing protein [Planctomycetes bacterium]|nr:PAS domain-containing protein [Planctomycetota bacterium]
MMEPTAAVPADGSTARRIAPSRGPETARIARGTGKQWRLFNAALSHTPDFAYVFDLDGRFLYVNRALLELWRKPFAEAVGRDFFELGYPPELAARLQRQIAEVVATRGQVRDQTPFTDPDGTTRHYEYIFVPVLAEDGTVEAVAGSTRDITDRLRGEEELRTAAAALSRSNLELERFAAVASHDLQEPLRMVAGFLTLLEERCAGQLGADARSYIGRAMTGTTRMQALIANLLAYARLGEVGEAVAVDLGETFAAAIDNLTSRIAETRGTVTADALPTVRGDATRLLQLLQNLIGNALKFRAAMRPPVVHVSAERDGTGWVLAVRDNGIGIAPAHQERIFGAFQRAFTSGTYDGSGLGLAICKKIAESNGGWIRVASQEGTGTVFTVHLPALE